MQTLVGRMRDLKEALRIHHKLRKYEEDKLKAALKIQAIWRVGAERTK